MAEMNGGDMVEYELMPMAGGTSIWWPDPSKYKDEHVAAMEGRVRRKGPGRMVSRGALAVLADLPHEVTHCLQSITQQQHNVFEGSEWSAEYDASVASLNVLQSAVDAAVASGDGTESFLAAPGLFETVWLFLCEEVACLHAIVTSEATAASDRLDDARYRAWVTSSGNRPRCVELAITCLRVACVLSQLFACARAGCGDRPGRTH